MSYKCDLSSANRLKMALLQNLISLSDSKTKTVFLSVMLTEV